MRRITLLVVLATLVIVGCQSDTTRPGPNPAEPPEAHETASEWIRNAPTYAYDGQDLQLVDQETEEDTTVLTYNFTSTHGGYGNRSGEMVTQVLTPHTIEVTVEDGEVIRAIIDEQWDERKQQMIDAGHDEPAAEQIARTWIRNAPTYRYDGQGLELESKREDGAATVFTYNFTSTHGGYGNRSGQMVTQVLTPHTIEVTVEDGEVTEAIVDEEWNELTQGQVSDDTVELSYAPMQCNKTSWERAYEAGNITFVQEPTDAELIQAYYSSRGVEVSDVQTQQLSRPVCEACYTCPRSYTYTAIVNSDSSAIMREDGWKQIE